MSKKHGDFTEKPKEGWVHDTNALSAPNLFFSYPAIYLGSIQLDKSLRPLSPDDQATLTRDLIRVVAIEAKARSPSRQFSSQHLAPFMEGQVTAVDADVNLNISAKGFMIVPVELEADGNVREVGMLEFSQMHFISLAAGGEDDDYDLICYVAKNEFGLRECYVFDCGSHSQEVLETMGQAFSIANGVEKAPKGMPSGNGFNPYDTIPEELKHQVQRNAAYQPGGNKKDQLPGDSYLEVGEVDADSPAVDAFSNPLYDQISDGDVVVSQYQHVNDLPPLDPSEFDGADKDEVVRKLNHVDKVRRCVREQTGQYFDISPEDTEPVAQPKWNYFDISPDQQKKVPVSSIRGNASLRKHWKQ